MCNSFSREPEKGKMIYVSLHKYSSIMYTASLPYLVSISGLRRGHSNAESADNNSTLYMQMQITGDKVWARSVTVPPT